MIHEEKDFNGASAAGRFLPHHKAQRLLDVLQEEGYRCFGPVEEEGEIRYGQIGRVEQLARGRRALQEPGRYELVRDDAAGFFSSTPGAQALKPLLFPPREALWMNLREADGGLLFSFVGKDVTPFAVIGVRACDLAALALLDRHFLGGVEADPHYRARRERLFVVGVDCTAPAATCFCAATGDGPAVSTGADIIATELETGFLLRQGSTTGGRVMETLDLPLADTRQLIEARDLRHQAGAMQTRRLPPGDMAGRINRRLEYRYWESVGSRCLACGNCTAVCPTCFCHEVHTELALRGDEATQVREWDSCYAPGHSNLHGRPVRRDTAMRYRQWLSHKFANWKDQYGRSGCVGCGRCITWCPVGIDITRVLAELMEEAPR